MSYEAAKTKIVDFRKGRISALLGEAVAKTFTSMFSSIKAMLDVVSSDEENKAITEGYSKDSPSDKIQKHVKLGYVCSLRRDIRKQYVSEEDDVYTDVTPFRHAIMSAHGANMFDKALDSVLKHKGA